MMLGKLAYLAGPTPPSKQSSKHGGSQVENGVIEKEFNAQLLLPEQWMEQG
jgi:hypothetical protein